MLASSSGSSIFRLQSRASPFPGLRVLLYLGCATWSLLDFVLSQYVHRALKHINMPRCDMGSRAWPRQPQAWAPSSPAFQLPSQFSSRFRCIISMTTRIAIALSLNPKPGVSGLSNSDDRSRGLILGQILLLFNTCCNTNV